jgi:hypothetical protein
MFSRNSIVQSYFKHSILILLRYQQIYAYLLLIGVLILMPLIFSIKERYFSSIYSLNFLVVLWLFSPYYLNMFSFSSEDARSLSLFPFGFKYLVLARNYLNFSLLMIAFGLSIVLTALFYPKTNTNTPELIVLSIMSAIPAISIGNLTSRAALSWTGKSTFSWKGVYVILVFNINILIFKVTQHYFGQPVFVLIIAIVFMIYIGFFYLSFQKIVKDITTYFSSIAEK